MLRIDATYNHDKNLVIRIEFSFHQRSTHTMVRLFSPRDAELLPRIAHSLADPNAHPQGKRHAARVKLDTSW